MAQTTTTATLTGTAAIVSWGALGLLGKLVAHIPPMVVMAICFLLAGIVGLGICLMRKTRPSLTRQTFVSAGFITAYHLLYLASFSYAPAIEVSLLNYLWPAFLIILGNIFFGLGSGSRGLFGAGMGFFGVALLIVPNAGFQMETKSLTGYVLAIAAAMIWAIYSNVRRKADGDVVTSLTSICLLSGTVCLLGAGLISPWSLKLASIDMLWISLLAAGPAGGAFFAWDYGLRHGNAALLSVLGFAAPLISTAMLIAAGFADATLQVVISAGIISIGGWIARK
ncbi:MAG: DMT family transporter [Beijerinckiaceae bacterium]